MKPLIILTLLSYAFVAQASTVHYSILGETMERGYCIEKSDWAPCPQEIIDYDRARGGVEPYTSFEKGSQEYWWAFCTEFREECIY